MAYFNNDPQPLEQDYQPAFRQDAQDGDEYYDEYDDMLDPAENEGYVTDEMYYDEFLSEEERAEARLSKWRMLAGVGDFFGVLAGTVVILLLVALLVNLVTWVQSDISQSFTLWQTKI